MVVFVTGLVARIENKSASESIVCRLIYRPEPCVDLIAGFQTVSDWGESLCTEFINIIFLKSERAHPALPNSKGRSKKMNEKQPLKLLRKTMGRVENRKSYALLVNVSVLEWLYLVQLYSD